MGRKLGELFLRISLPFLIIEVAVKALRK